MSLTHLLRSTFVRPPRLKRGGFPNPLFLSPPSPRSALLPRRPLFKLSPPKKCVKVPRFQMNCGGPPPEGLIRGNGRYLNVEKTSALKKGPLYTSTKKRLSPRYRRTLCEKRPILPPGKKMEFQPSPGGEPLKRNGRRPALKFISKEAPKFQEVVNQIKKVIGGPC